MKKTYLTTVMIVASMVLGLVFSMVGSSALAAIFNPSRTVSTAGFLTSPVGDADVADTITVSNYLLLAGGTLTGNLAGTNASMSITETTTLKATTASVSTGLFNISLKLPTYTTLSVANYIAWDTASASLKLYDGSNTIALAGRDQCFTIPFKDPTSTDEFGAVPFFDGGTLTQVSLNHASGSNAVGWNLKYGRPNAVTTAVFAANKSASSSANIIKYTVFGNSTPGDGDVMNFVISSSSTKIEDISVGVCYRN